MVKYLITILLTLLFTPGLHAQGDGVHPGATSPEQYIEQGDPAEAIRQLERQVATAPSATAYYHLGVAHTQLEQYPAAILAYERALLIEPTFKEARHNLQLLYTSHASGLGEGHSLPLLDSIAYALEQRTLQALALIFFGLLIVLLIVFRLGSTIGLRKVSFYTAVFVFFLWLGCNALLVHHWYYHRRSLERAIVMEGTVLSLEQGGEGVDSESKSLDLPAGAVLFIRDTLPERYVVALDDGRIGSVSAKAIARVAPQ